MSPEVQRYLDSVFDARKLPTIAFGAFLPFLIDCVMADGGKWDELHRYFEFPPKITGEGFEIVNVDEIMRQWWNK